jgi:hypothetical protein
MVCKDMFWKEFFEVEKLGNVFKILIKEKKFSLKKWENELLKTLNGTLQNVKVPGIG